MIFANEFAFWHEFYTLYGVPNMFFLTEYTRPRY